jgi:hypothetical protein
VTDNVNPGLRLGYRGAAGPAIADVSAPARMKGLKGLKGLVDAVLPGPQVVWFRVMFAVLEPESAQHSTEGMQDQDQERKNDPREGKGGEGRKSNYKVDAADVQGKNDFACQPREQNTTTTTTTTTTARA